jgi:hypothetical protein
MTFMSDCNLGIGCVPYGLSLRLLPYYKNERYHEAIRNVTPADVYFGRQYEVLTERSKMKRRKKEYLAQKAA